MTLEDVCLKCILDEDIFLYFLFVNLNVHIIYIDFLQFYLIHVNKV